MALGAWSLRLNPAPQQVLDRIDDFGHIVVHAARQNPRLLGDTMLASARYVGVVRSRTFTDDSRELTGPGMAFWLGDEDGKGPVLEPPLATFVDVPFAVGVAILLPDTLNAGVITAMPGAGRGDFVGKTSRAALTEFCEQFSDELGPAEWRVNPDGSVDAGPINALYSTTPTALITQPGTEGVDMRLRAVPGQGSAQRDMEDWSTRVVVIGEDGTGQTALLGQADIDPDLNPYRDLLGQPVRLTRVASASSEANPQAMALQELARYTRPRTEVTVDTDAMEVEGVFRVGDFVHVWSPDAGLVARSSSAVEVMFRGRRLNPVTVRVAEMSWPITAGMGVAYRGGDGAWTDLTDWVEWEQDGGARITVGSVARNLLATTTDPVSSRSTTTQDATVPDVPLWI